MDKMIQRIEELSLNSWPALQTLLFDGWILRFANGFTKRSNSVSPLYGSSQNPEKKIHFCENLYQNMGMDVVFKMTASVHPKNLDKILESKGYIIDSPTSVQILELGGSNFSPTQMATLASNLSKKWLSEFCHLINIQKHQSTFKKILNNIVPVKCFASLGETGKGNMISCGLGVLQKKYLALYALRLYSRLGFKEIYRYWYRIRVQ